MIPLSERFEYFRSSLPQLARMALISVFAQQQLTKRSFGTKALGRIATCPTSPVRQSLLPDRLELGRYAVATELLTTRRDHLESHRHYTKLQCRRRL